MPARIPLTNNNGHRPMEPTDWLDEALLRISPDAGNTLQKRPNGLYTGSVATRSEIYVSSSGVDAPDRGGQSNPLATFDYALTMALSEMLLADKVSILLQVGGTFVWNSTVTIPKNNTLLIGFYGDSRGRYDTPIEDSLLWATADVLRPILNVGNYVKNALVTSRGVESTDVQPTGSVELYGINLGLAVNPVPPPSQSALGRVDVFDVESLSLNGCVVNKRDNSMFGLLSVRSRAGVVFSQFASQYRIRGRIIDQPASSGSGITTEDLASRRDFVHFYNDYAGNDLKRIRLTPASSTSSNGSGMLTLYWPDCEALQIGVTQSLNTFPLLTGATYGLTNYFTGVRREQQRLVNILSPRTF